MKKRWIFLFLKRSILQRKGRVIIASISVTLAVAVITGMIGITAGIKEKLGLELKAYGANIIVSPAENNYLNYDAVGKILRIESVNDAEGQVLGNVRINDQSIENIGLDINKFKDRGWRLSGKWPAKKYEMLAGINLKDALKLDKGETILLEKGPAWPVGRGEGGLLNSNREMEFTISGFIERGGPEDNSFIISTADAWELTGEKDRFSTILVRGKPGELNNSVDSIKNILPSAEVKTFRQVAFAEESLLRKIQLLMAMVTVVVLFAAVISVAATMGANVLERREEIGLMMAIGATRNAISLFYVAEAVLIGLLGGIAGFVSGYFSAQAISKGAFGSFITMPYYTVVLSLVSGLLISLSASHFPVRNAMKQSPAVILKGE